MVFFQKAFLVCIFCSPGAPPRSAKQQFDLCPPAPIFTCRRGERRDDALRDFQSLRDREPRATFPRMYWACAQLDGRRQALAQYCLSLGGHTVYQPRIRSQRGGSEPLFASYVFITIALQWHTARWAPGVVRLLMSGEEPARVADHIISGLRSREGRNGLITLPPPRGLNSGAQFQPGDKVRVKTGPLVGRDWSRPCGHTSASRSCCRCSAVSSGLTWQRPMSSASPEVARFGANTGGLRIRFARGRQAARSQEEGLLEVEPVKCCPKVTPKSNYRRWLNVNNRRLHHLRIFSKKALSSAKLLKNKEDTEDGTI